MLVFVVVIGCRVITEGWPGSQPSQSQGHTPPSTYQGEQVAGFPEGDPLVAGFTHLRGHVAAGVDVYIQGMPGVDNDPPKYLFTIVDPSVDVGMIAVRYGDGPAEIKAPAAMEQNSLMWVRN